MTGPVDVVRIARALWRHPRADRAQIRAFQDERLRAVVAHAYDRVPFYRELFQRHRVQPGDIRTVADLTRLPVISRRDLRAAPVQAIVAQGFEPTRLITSRTSGSTGEPFEIQRSWLEQNLLHLFRLRAHRQLGKRVGDRLAMVMRVRAPHERDNKMLGQALARLGLGTRLILDVRSPPERNLARLEAFGPEVVAGYPNALWRIGELLDQQARGRLRPRLLISGAEVLTPARRARLRELWSAPVFETYGSHEFNLIAWQCRDTGGLHTCDDSLIVEVLQGDRPARPGERGEPVITALHAYAMPFIRYRLGDTVTRGPKACACGQPFGRIESIQGRMLDYMRLANGRRSHPYELIVTLRLDELAWVGQYQLVQEREDSVVLRVVPAPGDRREQIAAIERQAAGLVGPGVGVRVESVPVIAPDAAGKVRVFRSLVAANQDEVDGQRPAGPLIGDVPIV